MDKWKYCVIDDYKPLEHPEEWLVCPKCNEKPRVWLFDNGRFAKCCCGHIYDNTYVRAESVLSVYSRCKGNTSKYKTDDLRKAWNKYITTGIPQNKLPKGQW